jgi:hypothetical protein
MQRKKMKGYKIHSPSIQMISFFNHSLQKSNAPLKKPIVLEIENNGSFYHFSWSSKILTNQPKFPGTHLSIISVKKNKIRSPNPAISLVVTFYFTYTQARANSQSCWDVCTDRRWMMRLLTLFPCLRIFWWRILQYIYVHGVARCVAIPISKVLHPG